MKELLYMPDWKPPEVESHGWDQDKNCWVKRLRSRPTLLRPRQKLLGTQNETKTKKCWEPRTRPRQKVLGTKTETKTEAVEYQYWDQDKGCRVPILRSIQRLSSTNTETRTKPVEYQYWDQDKGCWVPILKPGQTFLDTETESNKQESYRRPRQILLSTKTATKPKTGGYQDWVRLREECWILRLRRRQRLH